MDLDDDVKISRLDLSGHGLRDDDIDLTKLPPNLQVLMLDHNDLTTVDLSSLPPTLKTLSVAGNKLRHVDLTNLPKGLVSLYLQGNELSFVALAHIPESLRMVDLKANKRGLLCCIDPTLNPTWYGAQWIGAEPQEAGWRIRARQQSTDIKLEGKSKIY